MNMAPKVLCTAAWLAILTVAALLRFEGLGTRPVHADEATGARILAERLEGGGYTHNPRHFHGPTLSQIAYPFASLRGDRNWQSLNIETLRASTALAGTLVVLTPLLWLRYIGPWPTLLAAAFLATSPLLVVYSRIYIHESWLALFGMLAAAAIFHLITHPSPRRALIAGVLVGLMFATKITFAISLLSWALAALAWYALIRSSGSHLLTFKGYLRILPWCVVGFIGASALLYSNFAQNPIAFFGALQSFFIYEPVGGHEKPFGYYFRQMIWPKQAGGVWWSEGLVLLPALIALFHVRLSDRSRQACFAFLALSVLVQFIIYSAFAYKTPWLMLLPWAQLCLIAGALVSFPAAHHPAWRGTLIFLAVLALAFQFTQARSATGRFENTSHNPYNYVPTSQDVQRFGTWLGTLHSLEPFESMAVVGREYWPIPWYLKSLEARIDYWPLPDATDLRTYPVVIVMPAEREAAQTQLAPTHTELPRSLRTNVPIFLFLQNELWNLWFGSDDV